VIGRANSYADNSVLRLQHRLMTPTAASAVPWKVREDFAFGPPNRSPSGISKGLGTAKRKAYCSYVNGVYKGADGCQKFLQPKEVFDMPVAKIHVHEGAFRDSELATIGTAVQAALEEVLSVPPEDYFRITHVLPKGQFVHTPAFVGCTYSNRFVLLELTFISGRPKDKRLALLAALNRLVVEKAGLRPDDLVVLIYEMPSENISFGQGLAQRAHISA
jgi:phenylpyruvate tautomerase PptA (4-oxalocrotonate tautomerase family)